MRTMRLILPVLVAGLLVVTGCSKPPEAEMSEARKAIEDARNSEAAEYAAESWQAAQDAMKGVEAELKVQDEKFALFRSYKETTNKVNSAKAAAEKAKADAAAGKERVRQEAETAINEAQTFIAETKTALDTAPRGKGTSADLTMLQSDITAAEASLAEAQSALAAGRYRDAQAKAAAARSSAESVRSAVEQAAVARAGR